MKKTGNNVYFFSICTSFQYIISDISVCLYNGLQPGRFLFLGDFERSTGKPKPEVKKAPEIKNWNDSKRFLRLKIGGVGEGGAAQLGGRGNFVF
jgi:hypothetical protein